jgi:hypothetical protein
MMAENETPQDEPTETPATEQPAETPAEQPVEAPAEPVDPEHSDGPQGDEPGEPTETPPAEDGPEAEGDAPSEDDDTPPPAPDPRSRSLDGDPDTCVAALKAYEDTLGKLDLGRQRAALKTLYSYWRKKGANV